MVANFVEFMDGPCKGEKATTSMLNITEEGRYVYRWKDEVLYEYELRAGNKAYFVNIDRGRD